MKLLDHPAYKFDTLIPVYNWIYPSSGKALNVDQGRAWEPKVPSDTPAPISRALYFHIPFCETICSFCPFLRGKFRDKDVIAHYVEALCREIELKSKYRSITEVPIGAIFFGGGTPSLLSPAQIRRIGAVIRNNFDLSRLKEFSFEFEVKSVNADRVQACHDIGVTHARFGLQTLNPKYRDLFALTATVEQIHNAVALFHRTFPNVSADVLYGMNGQSVDEIVTDAEQICALGLRNLDFYPINNLVTQRTLHARYRAACLTPTTGLSKHYFRLMLREVLESRGYLPHNGHGFVSVGVPPEQPGVLTDAYSFVYHEHVYGYADHDLVGFGTNAISSGQRFTEVNTASRKRYITSLIDEDLIPSTTYTHGRDVDASRCVALRLPYHGSCGIAKVDWNELPGPVLDSLEDSIEAGLVIATADQLLLTEEGWAWYSNLMYYLMPHSEQHALATMISQAMSDTKKDIESSGIDPEQLASLSAINTRSQQLATMSLAR